MTDTIAHNGRTYTLAENIYSAKIDGDPLRKPTFGGWKKTCVASASRLPQ